MSAAPDPLDDGDPLAWSGDAVTPPDDYCFGMSSNPNLDRTAAGADASRRVAWARYYEACKDVERLLRHNRRLIRHLARLAVLTLKDETLRVMDPEGELSSTARGVLGTLRLYPNGRDIVAEVEAELGRW